MSSWVPGGPSSQACALGGEGASRLPSRGVSFPRVGGWRPDRTGAEGVLWPQVRTAQRKVYSISGKEPSPGGLPSVLLGHFKVCSPSSASLEKSPWMGAFCTDQRPSEAKPIVVLIHIL